MPSSALRSCTAENLTSVRPHFSHVSLVIASVLTLCRSTVWTVDSCWRRRDGKSVGLLFVTIVFEAASVRHSISVLLPVLVKLPEGMQVVLTSILGAAAFAHQDVLGIAFRRRQKVAAVSAKDERSNGRHVVNLQLLFQSVIRLKL